MICSYPLRLNFRPFRGKALCVTHNMFDMQSSEWHLFLCFSFCHILFVVNRVLQATTAPLWEFTWIVFILDCHPFTVPRSAQLGSAGSYSRMSANWVCSAQYRLIRKREAAITRNWIPIAWMAAYQCHLTIYSMMPSQRTTRTMICPRWVERKVFYDN